jgi:hypothetical protein
METPHRFGEAVGRAADPSYVVECLTPSLRASIAPEWPHGERPTERHSSRWGPRRSDCSAESKAGRTKIDPAGRVEHCRCGGRRPVLDGKPDGDWVGQNSALTTPPPTLFQAGDPPDETTV